MNFIMRECSLSLNLKTRMQSVTGFENTPPTACMNFVMRELCHCPAAGEGADGPVPHTDWQAAAEEPAVGQAVGHCAGGE